VPVRRDVAIIRCGYRIDYFRMGARPVVRSEVPAPQSCFSDTESCTAVAGIG
jgi:hypothetical protein